MPLWLPLTPNLSSHLPFLYVLGILPHRSHSTVLIIMTTDNTPVVVTSHTLSQSGIIFRLVFGMFPFPRSTNSVECRFLCCVFFLGAATPPCVLNYRNTDTVIPRGLLDLIQWDSTNISKMIQLLLMW